MKELCKNTEYVYKIVNEARDKMISGMTLTESSHVKKVLSIMYLYCNDNIKLIILAILNELFMREFIIGLK